MNKKEGVLSFIGVLGVAVITALVPYEAKAYTFDSQLGYGASGSEVSQLQQTLKSLNFFTYPEITGFFGQTTQSAVEMFQASKGIASSGSTGYGHVGPATLVALNSLSVTTAITSTASAVFSSNLSTGMQGAEVFALQQFLNTHGFPVAVSGAGSPGLETETFGPATQAALAKFQKANGISPSVGFFGPVTRQAIAQLIAPQTESQTQATPAASQTETSSDGIVTIDGKAYISTTGGLIAMSGGAPIITSVAAPAPSAITPTDVTMPSIIGTSTVGQTLTVSSSWVGSPTPTLSYQWYSAGIPISGATNSSFAFASSDVGYDLTVAVTATNSAGSLTETSPSTIGMGGQTYNLDWQDDFNSLSLRTGGPTPAGYDGGKGTWADGGAYWFNTGLNDTGSGGLNYTEGWAYDTPGNPDYKWEINHAYNWQAIDPTFPVLGMLDITTGGLVLKATSNYPLIRQSLPVYASSTTATDYVAGMPASGGTWYGDSGATAVNGTPVDGITPKVVSSGGSVSADWQSYNGGAVTAMATTSATTTVEVLIKYNPGTAGNQGYFVLSFGSAGSFSGYWNASGTYSVNRNSGNLSLPYGVNLANVSSHKELSFNVDLPAGSTGDLAIGVGPATSTAGQNIILYDAQVLGGAEPAEYKYLTSSLNSDYSAKIEPPFYRETVVSVPNNAYAWPAIWGSGNKGQLTDPAQGFVNDAYAPDVEIDDLERLGEQDGDSSIEFHVHTDTEEGSLPNGYENVVQGGVENIGTNITGTRLVIGMWVTDTQVNSYVNGVFQSSYALPASSSPDQLMHTILDMLVWSQSGYPNFSGTTQMTVRSVKIFAPPSNVTGIFPPAPPVPVLTWGGSFSGGGIPQATATGTVVATLSGATTYSVLGDSKFTVNGSNLMLSTKLNYASSTSESFYIEGFAADGTPGIVPEYTVNVGM